ncbi:leiomodin-2-like [Stegodyphus dumicola]|uniref:leiomodin-2-like n=1 Tax=Stegodyphus dumicola TaxID=202533 RepID=UPI0015AAE756|nr:leiomodin-2-like [Stegodyphus dumicola]
MSDSDKIKTLQREAAKELEPVKEPKKEEEIKRPAPVKRPEVPPPPVPPHATPPVPPRTELPPVPPHVEKTDIPIYAKVVKRKSSAKTLVISEMKAHRKAKEEMKPAVPPRMSLELKGDIDLTKFRAHTINIDGIPKTGFDFLDNW